MRPIALVLLLIATAGTVGAQEPKPSIDQIIDRIADLDKQRAEIEKQKLTSVGDLKAELKRLNERVEKLGLGGPQPTVPPVVPPVVPVDPLRAKLKVAIDASAGTSEEKTEWAKDLAALYRAAAKLATDPTVPTAVALKLKLREASAALIGPDALKEVRQAVAGELAGILPTDAALTAAQREQAEQVFKRLAEILEEIAK